MATEKAAKAKQKTVDKKGGVKGDKETFKQAEHEELVEAKQILTRGEVRAMAHTDSKNFDYGAIPHRKATLFTLWLIVFVDLIGFTLVIPVLSPMLVGSKATLLTGLSNSLRTIILGVLLAAYPIMQFFGSPILGSLSDKHGRKVMLLISELGDVAGYAVFAVGIMLGNIWIILGSRMLSGFMSGNLAIANSAVADISDHKSRIRNFGLIGMALGFGLVLGPFIGGNLASHHVVSWFNNSTPLWFASLLSLINVILIMFFLRETIREKIQIKIKAFTGLRDLKKAFKLENMRTISLVIFLFFFGFSFFTQFFQVFLIDKFSLGQQGIGDIFGYIGIFVAITEGILIRPISKRFSSNKILLFSLIMFPISLLALLLPGNFWYLLFILPFAAFFIGLTIPSTTATISNLASDDSQGEAMGINQSVQSAGEALPPLIAGFVAAINFSLPVIVAAACALAAWLVFIAAYSKNRSQKFRD